ncbi:hypothetical protein [Cryobacterium luteum]|uniref:Uncharacterized protein n=1 Tax=Cryobacterium luteum TaxID=1424661 RepID=A0A1H8FSM9_9MICO|nr:hypothetical protein [Cryobacterium luteum]TFB93460.1 hypothetical protein E3O10_04140 [Cryobacterium luteum]SEN34811.1 hypothetical protein SAMN05216281_106149 [Cryobacterium luteum]
MPTSITLLLADLRTWPRRRQLIALGVATAVVVGILATTGLLSGPAVSLCWTIPTVVVGSMLIGLIVSSYLGTPIGADATLCDTRWPILGVIALYLTTEIHSFQPIFSAPVRPVVAAAAVALLVWALHERLESERKATRAAETGSPDGEVCTTCRPLFPRPAPKPSGGADVDARVR